MTKGIIPWSYSTLTAFETCPRKFKLTKIDRVFVEPQNEASLHGNEVHKAIERHMKNEVLLPIKYKEYLPLVEKCKAAPGKKLVEFKFALTDSFRPTDFFAKDAWCRGVIDFAVLNPEHALVLDWKTGKPKEDHDQLKLFAAVTFSCHPYLLKIDTGYVWLANNKLDSKSFVREDVAEIWQEFMPRVTRLTKAAENDNFPPKPSGLCTKWCPVTTKHCEFSGRLS